MKRVFSSFSLVAAHHARNLLEVEGIRAVVRNEILSSAMGELPPAECQIEVWILRDAEAQRAERVLHATPAGNETSWQCPSCSEACDPQFTQCWRCGAYRVP
jgi:hypothetical protein